MRHRLFNSDASSHGKIEFDRGTVPEHRREWDMYLIAQSLKLLLNSVWCGVVQCLLPHYSD